MFKKTEKTVVKKAPGRPRKIKPVATADVQSQVEQVEIEKAVAPAAIAESAAVVKGKYISAIGRRKEAAARVRFFEDGKGIITINGQELKKYFPIFQLSDLVTAPLKQVGAMEKHDISIKIAGGGKHSQADAVRHGISRVLVKFNADLKPTLKKAGFLTRDSRVKERKKFGHKKARKSPQWAKR